MPKLGMQPVRRDQLIRATVTTIGELGLADTTVARIADNAGLSAGIISHYFGSKHDLIQATMRQLLRELRDAVATRRRGAADTPRAQLRAIVDGNFDDSQVSPASMRVWLAFWASSLHCPELQRLQRANDRRLHSNICCQFRRVMAVADARVAALGLAAIIDGLWLRGTLSGGTFDVERARRIAYFSVDQYLQGATPAPVGGRPPQ